MFNLGYLPGGDKSVVTRPETTRRALEEALEWLRPGGLTTVVCYTGHPGGREDAAAVEAWARQVDQQQADVLRYGFVNQRSRPPYLIAAEKK